MKIQTVVLNKWFGGISDDARQQSVDVFAISAHFDIFSSPTRITPYRSNISNDVVDSTSSTMTQFYIRNFAVSEANGYLYGLGRLSSSNAKLRIMVKTDPIGTGANWAISASSSQTDNGVPLTASFTPYKSYLWGLKNANSGTTNKLEVWKYGDLSSGAKALTTAVGGADLLDSGGDNNVAQGLVGDDDCLYLPYANKLCKIDVGGTVTAAKLTLPSTQSITSLTKYQKYLAIATKPRIFGVSSKLYLWDYVSDDITEVIDFGEGDLLVAENIDGIIIGISSVSSSFNISAKTVFRKYEGSVASVIRQIPFSGLLQMKDKKSNKLYFVLSDGTTLAVWVFGRRSVDYPFAITIDRLINGSTAVTTLNAFKYLGDFIVASIGGSGNIQITDPQNNYSYTAYLKSQKYSGGSLRVDKTLGYLNLNHVPLPSGATISLGFAINSTNTFTSIFSNSQDGATYYEAVNQESNNNRQFPSYKEIQFKIEAVGFGEPIDLTFQSTLDDTLLIEE